MGGIWLGRTRCVLGIRMATGIGGTRRWPTFQLSSSRDTDVKLFEFFCGILQASRAFLHFRSHPLSSVHIPTPHYTFFSLSCLSCITSALVRMSQCRFMCHYDLSPPIHSVMTYALRICTPNAPRAEMNLTRPGQSSLSRSFPRDVRRVALGRVSPRRRPVPRPAPRPRSAEARSFKADDRKRERNCLTGQVRVNTSGG